MNKIPIIIDTDPGVDDFIALMLAYSHEKFDIKAMTSVAGNVDVELTTKNLKNIAHLLGYNGKLAKGALKPLFNNLTYATHIHGENGIGGVKLDSSEKNIVDDYAWDIIYKEAISSNGKLNIIALGPLTNIAIAILKYPDIVNHIEKIVLMGGSTDVGNITPYAEFNIWADAEAADVVFKSSIKKVMIGLNVTNKVFFNEDRINKTFIFNNKYDSIVKTMLKGVLGNYHEYGYDGISLHDAMAVAYLIDESIYNMKEYYVAIETRGKLNYGRTVVDLDNSHRDKLPNVQVAIGVIEEKFISTINKMVDFYK